MKKYILFLSVSWLLFSMPVLALDFDFSGNLIYHNDVLYFNFATPDEGNVTLFSSSWDDGGFDPMLGLWTSSGDLVYFQDDGGIEGSTLSNGVSYTHGDWDSYYTVALSPGDYTVTLTTYSNFNNSDMLSGGFEFDGEDPISLDTWDQPANGNRDSSYVFHILNVPSASQEQDVNVVPEPGTILLMGVGFGCLALLKRKKLA
ncbi:MAG: DVUA0089 family protein [Desulfuromonadaceae bacterium]|nr:DVUA0089 family protein [Desulfuromonadaceae bacterium]